MTERPEYKLFENNCQNFVRFLLEALCSDAPVPDTIQMVLARMQDTSHLSSIYQTSLPGTYPSSRSFRSSQLTTSKSGTSFFTASESSWVTASGTSWVTAFECSLSTASSNYRHSLWTWESDLVRKYDTVSSIFMPLLVGYEKKYGKNVLPYIANSRYSTAAMVAVLVSRGATFRRAIIKDGLLYTGL